MRHKLLFLSMAVSAVLSADPLDFFVDGSFTYWYAKEDGLNVAETARFAREGVAYLPSQSNFYKQSFGYKPGFKVGIGMESKKEWSLGAEYTYYRGTSTKTKAPPAVLNDLYPGVWSVDSWFLQKIPGPQGQNLLGSLLSSKWHLGMDLGDLTVQRPFACSKTIEMSPFAGLRTFWIRQKMDISLTQADASLGNPSILPPQPLQSNNSSHAWALGPRFGSEMQIRLPMGFRLGGQIAASLVYENFTSVKHEEGRIATFVNLPKFQSLIKNYNTVRPVAEAGLGFGWKKCFSEKYTIDLGASYDFSYFWGQNMMKVMMDEAVSGSSSGDNDLYFQGLTVNAAFKY